MTPNPRTGTGKRRKTPYRSTRRRGMVVGEGRSRPCVPSSATSSDRPQKMVHGYLRGGCQSLGSRLGVVNVKRGTTSFVNVFLFSKKVSVKFWKKERRRGVIVVNSNSFKKIKIFCKMIRSLLFLGTHIRDNSKLTLFPKHPDQNPTPVRPYEGHRHTKHDIRR